MLRKVQHLHMFWAGYQGVDCLSTEMIGGVHVQNVEGCSIGDPGRI